MWDLRTGKKTQSLKFDGVPDGVMTLAFSPDGRRLVSGGDRVLRLWDVTTGKQLKLFGAGRQTHSVAFTPDGKYFAIGRFDDAVSLWDSKSLKVVRRFPGHGARVYSLAFSRDGKYLLTGSADQKVRLWEMATGKKIREWASKHPGRFWSVAFSPDGTMVAGGSEGSHIRVWNAVTGKEIHKGPGPHSFIRYANFAGRSDNVVSVSYAGVIRLWNIKKGGTERRLKPQLPLSTCATLSPDGQILAAGRRAED